MAVYAMTGGATGIGAAIKQQLRDAGHRVIVVDIKDADIEADLSSSAGRQQAISGIREAAGDRLDGLITCAGLGSHLPDKALIASVNYYGSVEVIEGLKGLLKSGHGSVVLISSNSASHPTNDKFVTTLLDGCEEEARELAAGIEGQNVYSGSKQAVARWMRRNTAAYAADGIRLNAVAPGYTQTPMTRDIEEDPTYGQAIRDFMASIPAGRPGKPEDMASAVSFLLREESAFICGSVLFVDGGHDAMLRPDQF